MRSYMTQLWYTSLLKIEKLNMTSQSDLFSVELENDITGYLPRFSTFDSWSGNFANRISLARMGFFYTGLPDKVQCEYCGGKLYWRQGLDPFTEHKTRFPGCAFILQLEADNRRPTEPTYQDLVFRIATFQNYNLSRSPNEMAAAGFFYQGPAGKIGCYYCGVRLRDWDKDHDLFNLHRICSPACSFIRDITDFEKLGISTAEQLTADERDNLRQTAAAEGTVNQVAKQDLVDTIDVKSDLFQHLLRRYDRESIWRKMVAMIQKRGRNFGSYDEFVSHVTRREAERASAVMSVEQLKVDNDKLRKKKACKRCELHPVTIIFLPCGHLVSCSHCALNVTDCFICNTKIQGTVPVTMK